MKPIFRLTAIVALLLISVAVQAQRRNSRYNEYIKQYAPLAVEQMREHRIPASITLAQGLLESGAGQSTLARKSNNHFGIKCGSNWRGRSVRHDDDARNECFRAYRNPKDSYEDHSLFLKRGARYAFLFKLKITDYRGWARGLKKAGYATDPSYANRLITIIEDYDLYKYDTRGLSNREARNLEKAEELQRSGVQVVYGVKGLKTHAKICLVVRREQGMLRRYCHFGTGNYNETTAKIYTDISYLTCDDQLGADASQFFNSVTGRTKLMRFRKLYPSPVLMKARLIELIEGEAERARQGEPARISAKMNSLQDVEIIDALYRAADAGVDIELNVRGICCLKTGPRPNGKVIRVVSIVDRYLEHARIFFFHHGGNHQLFIASADWMTRNLDKRVELMVPVTNGKLARRLKSILDACFRDNVQACNILPDGTSEHVVRKKGQKAFRLQQYLTKEARRLAKDKERERQQMLEPHTPH